MMAILGQKLGMTQIWDDRGRLVGATVIKAEPNTIIEKGDNFAVIGTKSRGKTNKAQRKIAGKIGTNSGIWIKKVVDFTPEKNEVTVNLFTLGGKVAISATTKGKGFAGTIKRHNFHRGPTTHGSHNIRQPGSIGAQRPQRVTKGKKMAGRMGGQNLTVRGGKILKIDEKENLLVISGAVPGTTRARVIVYSLD